MARPKGTTSKSVYIEVSDDLWAKVKVHCFNTNKTLKQFVTALIEKALK